jgi:hypothetical protein
MSPPTTRKCRQTVKSEGQTGHMNEIHVDRLVQKKHTEITSKNMMDSHTLRQIVSDDAQQSIVEMVRQNPSRKIQKLSSQKEKSCKQTRMHRRRFIFLFQVN